MKGKRLCIIVVLLIVVGIVMAGCGKEAPELKAVEGEWTEGTITFEEVSIDEDFKMEIANKSGDVEQALEEIKMFESIEGQTRDVVIKIKAVDEKNGTVSIKVIDMYPGEEEATEGPYAFIYDNGKISIETVKEDSSLGKNQVMNFDAEIEDTGKGYSLEGTWEMKYEDESMVMKSKISALKLKKE